MTLHDAMMDVLDLHLEAMNITTNTALQSGCTPMGHPTLSTHHMNKHACSGSGSV